MAKKIAICTHKGGTGKTVTAIALATGLARAGQRTLLIDLDPQGHCSLGIGVDVQQPTIRNYFEQYPNLPLLETAQRTELENLDIIPSDLTLAWIAEGLAGRPKKEEILKRGMHAAEERFDWILMDTPPSLGALTQNAATVCDWALIPTLAEARAINAITDVLELLRTMQDPNFDRYRILLTRVDGRKTKTNETIRVALQPWQNHMCETVIPQSEPLNQAQMAREDIYTYDPNGAGTKAYTELIHELTQL